MAAEPGLLRISRTPYMRGPLLALQDIFIDQVVLVWGRQLSKSTTIYCFLCYVVAQDPGPSTFLLPTRDKAKEIQETKLDLMFKACSEIQSRMPTDPDDYTKLRMNFKTMVLAMAWAGSDTQTTTRSNRYLFVDEADEIKKQVGENAIDPIKGIRQTMTTFSNRKEIDSGTPTIPEGNIWQELKTCRLVFEYWVACPHCGIFQILYWENIKFGDDHDPIVVEEMAYYECEACQAHISNLEKIRALANGEWRARTTLDPCDQILKDLRARVEDTISLDEALKDRRVKKIGFHLPKWYSPFSGGTFGVIAKEFLEANLAQKEGSDFTPMRNWKIYNAAKPWEVIATSASETELLKNKIDLPSLICPAGTIALTAGADPGQGGFWFVVIAWDKDSGAHLVHEGWISGTYEQGVLDPILHEWAYEVQGEERSLHIWRMGIDTGGSEYQDTQLTMTAAAYEWIRKMRTLRLYGTKGLSTEIPARLRQRRIDKMPGDKGKPIEGGLTLIEINTDAMKELMWFRLDKNSLECSVCKKKTRFLVNEFNGPSPLACGVCGAEIPKTKPKGGFTFNSEIDDEYFRHLLAEKHQLQKNGKWEWVTIRSANHLLDATVIAFAMADSELLGGIRVLRPQPKKPDSGPGGLPSINPATQKPRGSWVKGWER
jgi:phage terminase large subunit GpA-like protein